MLNEKEQYQKNDKHFAGIMLIGRLVISIAAEDNTFKDVKGSE